MRHISSVLVLAVLGLGACDGGSSATTSPAAGATQADIGEVLATVNGTPVGSIAFQANASRQTPASGTELTLEERKEVLQRLINDELVYQEALRRGLDKDPKVKKVMVQTLLREEVFANVKNTDFTDADLQKYYDDHKDDFIVPEKVQIKRILIRVTEERPDAAAQAEAERIRGELVKNPEKFKDLAAELSEDPYKRRGGDVGFVSVEGKPGLDQAVVDKAFALPVNQVSEVFKTSEGYNIVLVANRRERVERTFQQMKGSVLRKVKNDKLMELQDKYYATLAQTAKVEIDEAKLAAIEVKALRRPGPDGGLTPSLQAPGLDGELPEGMDELDPGAVPSPDGALVPAPEGGAPEAAPE